MAVLDTNVLVDLMGRRTHRRTMAAREKVADIVRSGATLCTTRVNVMELWVGIELAGDRDKEIQRVERVLGAMIILEIGQRESQAFGQVTGHLRRVGRPAGDFDALIAAVALANGQSIVTRNPKHFADIPWLAVISY